MTITTLSTHARDWPLYALDNFGFAFLIVLATLLCPLFSPTSGLPLAFIEFAEASGFMQWSRPQHSLANTSTNTFASVAGINVINYMAVGSTSESGVVEARPTTDIVDSATGDIIVRVFQDYFYDTNVILVPAEDAKGYFTCRPLYTHAGEGNLATQPTWCGVLQFRKRDASAGAHIILPNATIIPLLAFDRSGASLPWKCSKEFPCTVRTQELRTGQLGGCQRRRHSSASYNGPSDIGPLPSSPPQSTHVTIAWKDQLFMFRPLVLAAALSPSSGLALISAVDKPQWTVPPERVDYLMQYTTVAYPLGLDNQNAPEGPFFKQWAICTLILLHENGTLVMYDSDRDSVSAGSGGPHAPANTGLMYFTYVTPPRPIPHCVPYVETVLKLMPCFEKSRTTHRALYSSTFALTCASGVGFFFDFIVQAPGVYPGNISRVGEFAIPEAFNTSALPPATPIRTDISCVLVQPYVSVDNLASGVALRLFSSFFSYTVAVALSRIEHNAFAGPGVGDSIPPLVTLMFASSVSTKSVMCPLLTRELIGVNVLSSFTTELHNATVQNVTNSLGWVSTAAIPANQHIRVQRIADSQQAMSDATARVARWVASDGLAYSVLTEDLHLLVNGSSGSLIRAQDFSFDSNGNAHGGVKSASPVRTNPFLNASSISPILAWEKPPPTATGIERMQDSLSSTFVLVTSPSLEHERHQVLVDKLTCIYSLNSHGGVTSSNLFILIDPNFVPPEGKDYSLSWQITPGLSVLYSPFTESFCATASLNVEDTHVTVIPAVDSVVIVQRDAFNASTDFSRVVSVPLRSVIASTTPLSYLLDQPLGEVHDHVIALNPVGSRMTYICAYDTIKAYDAVIGNETWSAKFTDLIFWCALKPCLCPEDNKLMTISSDRSFLILNILSKREVPDTNVEKLLMGVLSVEAKTGKFVGYFDPDHFLKNGDQCTVQPPLTAPFGPIVEFDPSLYVSVRTGGGPLYSGGGTVVWAGAATLLGSRCFAVFLIVSYRVDPRKSAQYGMFTSNQPHDQFTGGSTQHVQELNATLNYHHLEDPYYFYAMSTGIVFFRGTWAEFDDTIVMEGDSLFLSDTPSREMNSLGASVYCFSIAQILDLSTKMVGGIASFGILPTFAANNVLDSVSVNSLWYAVQVIPQRNQLQGEASVALYVYQSGVVSSDLSSAHVASYSVQNASTLQTLLDAITVFSLQRPGVPKVCVAASNVTCFDASTSLVDGKIAFAEGLTEHYGRPAVDAVGTMVFTYPGIPCHALVYGASDAAPRLLWAAPSWTGQNNGVDMNLDVNTCGDAVISDEGLLLMCLPLEQVGLDNSRSQHMYLLVVSTGRVILAFGPTVRAGTSTFSDGGSLITYVNAYATAITLELVGELSLEPFVIQNSFCLSDSKANYFIEFSSETQSVFAVKTPWDVTEDVIPINATSAYVDDVFPLRAMQFHGFQGIRMGKSFLLKSSMDLMLLLNPALPEVLRNMSTFNFLKGSTTVMTDSTYSIAVVAADSCPRCDAVTCPSFCTVSLTTGDQFNFRMANGTNSLNIWFKERRSLRRFNDTGKMIRVPFAGNASLVISRQIYALQASQQTFPCPLESANMNFPTITCNADRFCMAVPDLNGKKYTVIEVAPGASYATVSTFSTRGFSVESYWTYQQRIMTTPVYRVNNVPAMRNLINDGISAGAFPNSLSDGEVFNSIGAVVMNDAAGVLVYPPSMADPFELAPAACSQMDEEIPKCPTTFTLFNPSTEVSSTARSVVWKGSAGNWGSGFVAVGFEIQLPSIMRNPLRGVPVTCGGVDPVCPSQCQPTANCESQTMSYLNHYFYTTTMLPPGSDVLIPDALLAACNGTRIRQEDSADLTARFYCSKNGHVIVTTHLPRGPQAEIVIQSLGDNRTAVSPFSEMSFSCSDCSFFVLYGIISQPFEWIAAGAVKSLLITVLFYFVLEKVRKNHRYQTRAKNRHRHHSKRLEALLLRLREHELMSCSTASLVDDAAEDTVAAQLTMVDVASAFATSSAGNNDMPYAARAEAGAALFPGYTQQPLVQMTAEEQAHEKQLLLKEIERVQLQVREDKLYEEAHERSRWWLSRVLPNPIALYSRFVIALSGVRHPEEQRTILARVQEGLSTRHISNRQLIEMLMSITGEDASETHIVERFSHFYQWNMCLNRQVVVREFIEDQAHLAAPGVIDLMEVSLQQVHERLREAYVLFRLSFVDRRMDGNSQYFKHCDNDKKSDRDCCPDRAIYESGAYNSSMPDIGPSVSALAFVPAKTSPGVRSNTATLSGAAGTVHTTGKRQSGLVPADEQRAEHIALNSTPSSPFFGFGVGPMRGTKASAPAAGCPSKSVGNPPPVGYGDVGDSTPPMAPFLLGSSTVRLNADGAHQKKSFRPPEYDLRARGATFLRNAKEMYLSDKVGGDAASEAVSCHGSLAGDAAARAHPTEAAAARSTAVGRVTAVSIRGVRNLLFDSEAANAKTTDINFRGMDALEADGAVPTPARVVRKSSRSHITNGLSARSNSHRKLSNKEKEEGVSERRFAASSSPVEPNREHSEERDVGGGSSTHREVAAAPETSSLRAFREDAPTKQLSDPLIARHVSSVASGANGKSHSKVSMSINESATVGEEDDTEVAEHSLYGFVHAGCDDADWEEYKYTVAAQSLREEVDAFVEMMTTHPHCFEYAALPSRSIDDQLMPNTVLVIASIVQTIVTLLIYSVDVLRRSSQRAEGALTSFEVYQCVFFMVFNSSGPSALLVSVLSRADLGALEHTQTLKTKLRDLFTDPYVVVILTMFSFPLATHILPGMLLFAWMMLPALIFALAFEYYLRTRLSLQTRLVIAARFASRVIVLFVAALVLSLSFNYSAAYVWSRPEGYLKSGFYRQDTYLQIIVDDYSSRSMTCFYEHITLTISNFFQMGLLTSFL